MSAISYPSRARGPLILCAQFFYPANPSHATTDDNFLLQNPTGSYLTINVTSKFGPNRAPKLQTP